jgi:hypothetical protein
MRRATPLAFAVAACAPSDGSTGDEAGESSSGTSASTTVASTMASTSVDSTTGGAATGEGGSSGEGTGSSGASSSGSTGEVDEIWQAFLDRRLDDLAALSVPILDCVDNVDTGHAVFHGCIDWHSAVHATYSLHAIARLTGDPSYLEPVDALLGPQAIAAELADLHDGGIPAEVPYGYAWFLTLAREREVGTGETDLRPLGDEIALQLRAWIDSRTPGELYAAVLDDDYGNASWPLLNLWQWAQHTGDAELAAAMELLVSDEWLSVAYDDACPLSQEETDTDDFFPPCLHRLRTIVTVLPPAEHAAWLAGYLPAELVLTPIGEPAAAHIAGLNFSRSWGLWSAWNASGDVQWRDRYVDHVVTHVEQPQYWAENYGAYAHWVAQFGVYAIALSFE